MRNPKPLHIQNLELELSRPINLLLPGANRAMVGSAAYDDRRAASASRISLKSCNSRRKIFYSFVATNLQYFLANFRSNALSFAAGILETRHCETQIQPL